MATIPPELREVDTRGVAETDTPSAVLTPGDESSQLHETWPQNALPIVPMRLLPLFPGVVTPIQVGRERSVNAVQRAVRAGRPIGLILQRDPAEGNPDADDLYGVGTEADVLRYISGDREHHAIVQGRRRFRVLELTQRDPYYLARVEWLPEATAEEQQNPEVQARFALLRDQARKTLSLLPNAPEGLERMIQESASPVALTNSIAAIMDLPAADKQKLLETLPLREQMSQVLEAMAHQTEVLRVYREITEQTQQSLAEVQREHYLREQLRQIHKELGDEEPGAELSELAEALAAAGLPDDLAADARRELQRLESMSPQAAEYSMLRTYLEWLADLPWSRTSAPEIDFARAREILDADHYGLEKVKQRILEFLAVRKLNPHGKSPILCLVGPPGVGKTSLGQSIAHATGRAFVRVSLGGVHDESEIRGHRRTYVGAMPGNLIRGIAKAKTRDPVFMLDEIDKLGNSFRGDPAAALLEVLDPAQNASFRDHYLNAPFDLSKVLFIATANQLESIPGPLRDRCEVIPLSSYTDEEKLRIAQRYLIDRQREDCGLRADQIEFSEPALVEIIRHYTREAGCRGLEREIGALCRNAAARVAEGHREKIHVDVDAVREILGPARFESETRLRTSLPGVATGLAWTPAGGDLLFIEATRMPGHGKLLLTGQLGDVMQESARAAVSLVKAHSETLGIDPALFDESDLHVHAPAGATPKDGPSAGVALIAALVSLLSGRRVRGDVAMTGEISLRGLVLPVGGIKEKLLAAHRAGIRTALIPERNLRDLAELPEEVRDELEVIGIQDVSQLLDAALEE